jgi:hypothetical protein
MSLAERAFFEPRFGHDFGAVRIHDTSRDHEAARSLGARAFTTGTDIVLGKDEYKAGTDSGRRLLTHELLHVVQQAHTPGPPTTQAALIVRGDRDDFTYLCNRILQFQHRISVDSEGAVTLAPDPRGPSTATPSPAAQTLHQVLGDAIRTGRTEIEAVHGRHGVLFGAAVGRGRRVHLIDLDDIRALGYQDLQSPGHEGGGTAGALLAHEIREAQRMTQVLNASEGGLEDDTDVDRAYRAGHAAGLRVEGQAAGGGIRAAGVEVACHSGPSPHRRLHVWPYHYHNSIVDLIFVTIGRNEVVEARRATRPYGRIRLQSFPHPPGSRVITPVVEDGQPRFEESTHSP